MLHPLQQNIRALRRRIRRLAACLALGWVASAVLATAMVVGLADYVCRFEDPGLRLMASLAVLAVLCWSAYRFLVRGLSARLGEVDLARRLEQQFPQLHGNLASAVQFLRQAEDDPTAGSAALRRAVIGRTAAMAEGLDFRTALRLGPVWWAAATAGACLLAAGVLTVLDPTGSCTALARLVEPLGDVAWPQVHHLEIRKPVPRRVDRGGTFRVAVVDAPGVGLPSEVSIYYQFENPDGVAVEKRHMDLVGGMMVAQRENVTRTFSFWVEGGDDHAMRWEPLRVEVVERPAIKSLSIRLVPPAYTGWPSEQTEKNVRALVGTRLEISGVATHALASVTFCLEGGIEIPGRVTAADGSFRVPADAGRDLVVEKSGTYGFRLTDREGLTGEQTPYGQVHALPDSPPTVNMDEPAADVFVTPGGTVPIRVTARDDLAIHQIALAWGNDEGPRTKDQGPRTKDHDAQRTLYSGPANVPLPATGPDPEGTPPGSEISPPSPAPRPLASASGDQRTVTYRWNLEALHLQPGTQLSFWATAGDYRPHTSKSPSRRLSVVTPEEMKERIAVRHSAVLAELTRAVALQRQAREQVAASEKALRGKRRPDESDVGSLANAERNQRQVHRLLTSHSEGVPLHILALLADLENNKIDSPDVKQWMQTLLAKLGRLGREELPSIDLELTAATKTAKIHVEPAGSDKPVGWDKRSAVPASKDDAWRPTPAAEVRTSLLAAGQKQDAVLRALEQIHAELDRRDRFRGFSRDAGQLSREQEDLARRSGQLSQRTLGRDLLALPAEAVAELKHAGHQQRELARRLQALQQQMDQAAGQLQESDPNSAGILPGFTGILPVDRSSTGILPVELQALSDAAARLRQLDTSGKMQSVGGQLERNEIGDATEQQRQIIDQLHEILDILAHRPHDHPADGAVAEIAQLRQTVEGVRSRQERALQESRRLEAARKPVVAQPPAIAAEPSLPPGEEAALEELAKEQSRLGSDTASLAGKPTTAESSRATLSAAAREMALAAALLDRGRTSLPTQAAQRNAAGRLAEVLAALDRQTQERSGPGTPREGATRKVASSQAPSQSPGKPGAASGKAPSQPGTSVVPGDSGEGSGGGDAAVQREIDRVWGSLPTRERELLSQLPRSEEFLPKYEALLEEYFKRLAEQQRNRSAD